MSRRVNAIEDTFVRAALDSLLPDGLPSYVRRVLAVNLVEHGFHATVEVFDGGTVVVEAQGPMGHGRTVWCMPPGDPHFLWDRVAQAWRRATPDDVDAVAMFEASVMGQAHRTHA